MPENADTLAAALIAYVGHLDAIDWLEDELAETKCPRAAAMLCNIIDAVEAQSRGRLHWQAVPNLHGERSGSRN